MTEIVKKDVAECNAKILGELKDSLLPSIKYGHGEIKDILRQDVAECNAKMLGEVKDAIKDIQGELKDSL